MASVVTRRDKTGEISSYQVRWRLGGAADAPWQTERFDEEDSAKIFRDAVNDAGQQWPLGWVKGRGPITAEEPGDAAQYIFRTFALDIITSRSGISDRYRYDCLRDVETYLLPTFANCDVRSTEHFNKKTIQAWVNLMAETRVWRGSKHKKMAGKTLKNLKGLLSSILDEAVKAEPPLRERNPCELVRLPREDNHGLDDEDVDDDIAFLEPHEVEGIVACLSRDDDRRLVRFKYATGLRWGEITALAHRHADSIKPGTRRLRIVRAWHWSRERGHYLDPPKTRRGRRILRISPAAWEDLLEQGVGSGKSSALIFHNGKGERLPYSTFYDRWIAAVRAAHESGLLPDYKSPTLHDLRHSHASALISAGHSLTYVQRRLGHESIQTTSDRYGHLLPEADDAAMRTIDASLGGSAEDDDVVSEDAPQEATAPRQVYVAHLGGVTHGFWGREVRDAVAEQWSLDRGQPLHVETWSLGWWQRKVLGGINEVRHGSPDRTRVWYLGPAIYAADGTERVSSPDAHEVKSRWAWEWEQDYTDELAAWRAEWVPGSAETVAEAWGCDERAVRLAYAEARAQALRICALNPAAVSAAS